MPASTLRRLVPQAPLTLCRMLNPQHGGLEPPIRSELFGLQRFAEHGVSLGLTHRVTATHKSRDSFFPRLHLNIVRLRESFEYISVQANAGYDISPAAEWLIENFHLLEAQFKEISEGLPPSYFRTLPILVDAPLSGLPRVYAIAWAFVAHSDGAFDEDLLVHFLQAYQEQCELNISELWALPTTLRVVLMENLRRLAERVAANKGARELANLCCDHLETYDLDSLEEIRHTLQLRGVDRVFLAQMTQRLQESHSSTHATYKDWLQLALPDFAVVQTQQRADQAADNLSVSNAVTALRAIGDADWGEIVAQASVLIGLLLTCEVFAAEHTLTRDSSMHAIERLARKSHRGETEVARAVLAHIAARREGDTAQAVPSYWLLGAGRDVLHQSLGYSSATTAALHMLQRVSVLGVYLSGVMLMTAALVAALVWHSPLQYLQMAGLATLLFFPVSEAVVALINRLVSESSRPRHLHRLAFARGIPAEHKVLVVIPCMLSSPGSIAQLGHRLRLHYLANLEDNAQFALLSDWLDAPTATLPGDAALLQSAQAQMDTLNQLHPWPGESTTDRPPRFILLHRARSFCVSEQAWIGWERKRGKLEVLVSALATGVPGSFLDLGRGSQLDMQARYVVTLDSDTDLPPGRLRDLVGVAAHPYNEPRLDPQGLRVVSGYGILQPRVATPLPAAGERTRYHWLFAGQFGLDPYGAASSEIYQDLFDEGTFTGKGLLHVAAVHATLARRIPDDQVLSHDLLEGALARCGAVTDITLMEDAPFHADVAASRVHRWTRGDWQLLPLLLQARRYGISTLNGWKMLDNLRRSLVAPACLVLLAVSLQGPVLASWVALVVVLAAFTSGALIGAFAGFFPGRGDLERRHFYREALADLARALGGGIWHLALLLQNALLSLDAIARALYRMLISKRHLLQWTTAASAQASARFGLQALVLQHWAAPSVALVLAVVLVLRDQAPLLSILLCLVWAGAPVWIWFVSRPIEAKVQDALPPPALTHLRALARDTWRYFERTVTAQDRHLPPDNLQLLPHDMLAHRTSPTNIGLYLLSAACAREFGWLSTHELVTRLEATLSTLQGLERDHGHFLNWYDTQTGTALLPRYVSTVDSGNLSAHLLAVAQACRQWALAPDDTLALQCAGQDSRERLSSALRQRSAQDAAGRERLHWLFADERTAQRSARTATAALSPHDLTALTQSLTNLAQGLEALAWQPDYAFLYHRKRHLLHIGYRPAEQQLDAGFYDLLASEARLTSLVAIAKGDVPVAHWSALGRMFCVLQGQAGLRSWSGSMFEYLMPGLVIAEPTGSVLADACNMALREQIAFATALQVPWGISESAYAARDDTLAYQYAPQGVPRLALRRTPTDELVVAPYASVMAAQVEPLAAWRNLCALETLGARQRYGLVDALDYSPARQTTTGAVTLVASFMAHHQGMSIAALSNLLLGGVVQRWGMANPRLQAVGSILHERTPREISRLYTLPSDLPLQMLRKRLPGLLRAVVPGASAVEPTHLLSNGHYTVALRANGAGWSRWGQVTLGRTRDDLLRDSHGHFIYLDGLHPGPYGHPAALVSLTSHPAPDPRARFESVFHADRICFNTCWDHLHTQTTVWVSPEDDIEFRQVELRNMRDVPVELEVVSAWDATLAMAGADEAHPAFSGMFVRAKWLAKQRALVFERKPRVAKDTPVHAAHFLAQCDTPVLGLRVCTERAQWLGRNRDSGNPTAHLNQASDTSVEMPTGLDAVSVLAVRIRIAPQGRTTLTFATAAAPAAEALHAVLDKYQQAMHVQRASLMSATLAGIRMRALKISPEQFAALQSVCTAMLYSTTGLASEGRTPARHLPLNCDRRLLWRFGISGDRPILLVSVGVVQGAGLVRSLARAMRLWAWSGIACDLVVLNFEPSSYGMALQREIISISERLAADAVTSVTPTAMHLLRAQDLNTDEISTLQILARLHIHADGRPLTHHLQDWLTLHEAENQTRKGQRHTTLGRNRVRTTQDAPLGNFDHQTGAFTFTVSETMRPTRPWSNVLANPAFGCVLTESGGGFTWAGNSRLHQMTAWSNDPVSDPSGEWLLLQDSQSGMVWSLTPNGFGDPALRYQVTHGQGFTTIAHQRGELAVAATWCVDTELAVKSIRIVLTQSGERTKRLRLVGLVEWIMGAHRGDRMTCSTQMQAGDPIAMHGMTLLCSQRAQEGGFGGSTAFFSVSVGREAGLKEIQWTCDRREFFSTTGQLQLPAQLGRRCGVGLDPCAALSMAFALQPGAPVEIVLSLGHAPDLIATTALSTASNAKTALNRQEETLAWWDALLSTCTVRTPDLLLDVLTNRWLLYQTVSCRMWAKAGFYQAGGATGFRDQLQDAMALAWAAPDLLRQQIMLCASRQFPQGDVQHWWHAPTGAGVRTHFSDDLLWLPHALCHYLLATGDTAILDQPLAFLEGPPIPPGAEDAYFTPTSSSQMASVWEHAARTVDVSLRVGAHGLPLIGSGDWNDGMNEVGREGRGESVWLAWFLVHIIASMAPLARQRHEPERADTWEAAAAHLHNALIEEGWDGQWFRRAYFDNGQPLGASSNAECRIDLIAQAWSVLSGAAPLSLQATAMDAAHRQLVESTAGLVKLLSPPLQHHQPSAGYIQAYPPGVRENGGQYAHGAVWALMAQARLHNTGAPWAGDGKARCDLAYAYFTYLSPAHRSNQQLGASVYGLEPYAMAGDVYGAPPYVGRGGWSWYTGAAGLLHRAVVESIFGLQQEAQTLRFYPCLPNHWPQAEMSLRRDGKTLHFLLLRVTSEEAHAQAAHKQAQLLEVGESLPWATSSDGQLFIVPVQLSPEQRYGAVHGGKEAQ